MLLNQWSLLDENAELGPPPVRGGGTAVLIRPTPQVVTMTSSYTLSLTVGGHGQSSTGAASSMTSTSSCC